VPAFSVVFNQQSGDDRLKVPVRPDEYPTRMPRGSDMPSEIRRLLFRPRETIVAVTEYFQRRGITLPSGTASRIVIFEAEQAHASLEIATDTGGTVEIEVTAEMLAAALILYCINRKIPLPAEADKRLQRVQEDSVALVVTTHLKRQP
jgi:hypothetical protein